MNFDQEKFNKLSTEEQKVVLQILKEYSKTGKSELLDSLQSMEWDEFPVDIHTFLHDKRYLGNALYDAEGKFTVFPYWEKCLEDIFPTNTSTKYNTIVFTGAIGLGKSTIAVICLLYLLYRLLCLRDPYQYYGMQSIDKLSISMMNITLENARGVALDKMNSMLLASEWFMSHGEMHGTTNMRYVTDKHIEIICASSNNQIIGRALFANFTDEVNFSLVQDPVKSKKRMMKIITQVDARMKSRFMRGTYLPTLNIIASSKDSEQSFLEEFIQNKQKNESKNTLIVDEPQWVVDPRKDSPQKFWVAIGDKVLANELLPLDATPELVDEYRNKNYTMWQVPIGYLDTFQLNLDEAICSIIGIATAASLKYISGERLVKTKTTDYENPFLNDILEIGDGEDDLHQYSEYFDLSRVSDKDKEKPLFIHLDLSESGDMTGIAGVWITGRDESFDKSKMIENDFSQLSKLILQESSVESQMLIYKLAFSVSIKNPRGAHISSIKHRIFINWLKDNGFDIKMITSDTHQSATLLQELKADGFETEVLSVDRTTSLENKKKVCLPYHYFKTAIYERRFIMYDKAKLLTEELLGLEREADGHINHPENGKYGSKDQADAVCGAVWTASKNGEKYSFDFGDSIETTVQISKPSNTSQDEIEKHDFGKNLLNVMSKEKYIEVDEYGNPKYYGDLDDTAIDDDAMNSIAISNGIICI